MVSNPALGGGVGGSGQYSASTSSRSGADANEIAAGYSGAGNRGFHLNVAFPGATASGSADINPPLFNLSKPNLFLWGAIGLAAVALMLKLKR